MAITFTAETHKYESTEDEAKKIDWVSVTSLVGLFKKPFDQEGIAAKASKNKNSKWYGMTPKEIINVWKGETNRAVNLGSWYHDQREAELLMCDTLERSGLELPIVNPLEQDGVKIAPDQTLVSGIYPEHLVYLKSAGICGQADRVEVIQDIIDLYDYKTNKEIKREITPPPLPGRFRRSRPRAVSRASRRASRGPGWDAGPTPPGSPDVGTRAACERSIARHAGSGWRLGRSDPRGSSRGWDPARHRLR